MKLLGKNIGKILFTSLFVIPLIVVIQIPIFLSGAALATYLVFSRNLPVIPNWESYEPRTVSTFYADDGTVIGVFYKQKRFVVEQSQIPKHVINAFLAAEDAKFYEHRGVDWMSMGRATMRNALARRVVQGGSTITMQVTKNFLLSRERTFERKLKELILAPQLEQSWGKDKILYVYLNEIYLGEGSYGVEAAARSYFDKPVEHLSIAEGALIAGLVASPARYNPFKSEELARQRQLYVLGRMATVGFITQEEYQKAKSEPLKFKKEVVRPFDLVPDFAEAVRRYIVKKYGEDKLYNEGLKVFTTCRVDYQRKALEAMEKGLAEIRSRQKNLAILRHVPKEDISELLQKRATPELHEGKVYQGVVTRATQTKTKQMELEVWLSKRLRGFVRLDQVNHAYKVGQVLALRFERFSDDVPIFSLDNDPKLQGALVCIENKTGFVRALVGGTPGDHFKFNRATQARRQPGSAFKPLIYSMAIEEKSYSPATIIIDDPIEVELDNAEEDWVPRNSSGNFLGPLSFRRALELSRNICTIKILHDVKIDPVIALARRMGVTSELGRNPSISLGTSEVSLYELTSAYTVFPNSGIHVEPVLVKRIEDRFGNVLEDNSQIPLLDESEIPRPVPREEFRGQVSAASERKGFQGDEEQELRLDTRAKNSGKDGIAEQDVSETHSEGRKVTAALSPQTSYIMTQLLKGGVQSGTGASMRKYLDPKNLAGKTGTTNNAEDTWFIGFSPDFTAGVWVGFDEKRPVGNREEGSRAALPIWAYFMGSVLEGKARREFPVPPDITFKDMLTFTGSPGKGFTPEVVREPVYTPFAGLTLILSPVDPPEELAAYRGIVFPTPVYGQSAPGLPQQPPGAPTAIYPVQPGAQVPQHPMDGRYPVPPVNQPQSGVQRPATQAPQSNYAPVGPTRQPDMRSFQPSTAPGGQYGADAQQRNPYQARDPRQQNINQPTNLNAFPPGSRPPAVNPQR